MRNIPQHITMRVIFSIQGQHDFDALPLTIRNRVAEVIERLTHWPEVSGAKALRGELAGKFRIRTGDWRVIFRVQDEVLIIRIDHRSTIYED